MSIADPREDITHDIEIGQVYEDSRSGSNLLLVYLDSNVALIRDRDGNHRLEKRRHFEQNVGAGRFKLRRDAASFGETGRIERIMQRLEEYASRGGRKNEHYASAMEEAVEILTDQGAQDAREAVEFEEVDGIGQSTASALRTAGIRTRGDVRSADDDELLAISGVGSANLAALREYVG